MYGGDSRDARRPVISAVGTLVGTLVGLDWIEESIVS